MRKFQITLLTFVSLMFLTSNSFASIINLTGTIRDFNDTHPDFEDGTGVDPGIVESTLGTDVKPVYAGLVGNPTTHGQTAFDQWYRNTSGVNLSQNLTIPLDNTITADPNVYTYTSNSFFPIDEQLFGNQGRSHNYHFTYEIQSSFTYSGGESFSFTGADDLWVFIDNILVIDLGGVHGPLSSSVSLDTLGLAIGYSYDFDLYFAERHTVASNFRIDTSINLDRSIPEPSTTLLMVIGLASISYRRRYRPA